MVKTICKSVILLATALLIVTAVGLPAANAQLASMAYGFPQVFHNAETTAFNRDILNQISNEAINIDFGAAGLCGLGGFPTISQVSEQSTYAESTNYYHTEETDAIGYPYVATGTACAGGLPGLGALPYYGGYGGWC
jgi:hypothetical protein